MSCAARRFYLKKKTRMPLKQDNNTYSKKKPQVTRVRLSQLLTCATTNNFSCQNAVFSENSNMHLPQLSSGC
jgi:hypothetical protein